MFKYSISLKIKLKRIIEKNISVFGLDLNQSFLYNIKNQKGKMIKLKKEKRRKE